MLFLDGKKINAFCNLNDKFIPIELKNHGYSVTGAYIFFKKLRELELVAESKGKYSLTEKGKELKEHLLAIKKILA